MGDLANNPLCYRCNAPLVFPEGRVGRRDECPQCHSDAHVCKNCRHYDPKSYNECREPQADRVVDKEKSNFCDYFSLGRSGQAEAKSRDEALKKLDDLFK